MPLKHQNATPTRRRVLAITGAATLIAAGADPAQASKAEHVYAFRTLSQAMNEVHALAQARSLQSQTEWTWAQTLVHAAQSIEYSMTGYPQERSVVFQRTLGAAAFAVFEWRGRMSHSLVEPIPGAPGLDSAKNASLALERLELAVGRFQAWTGLLRPHFAYGALSKPAFEHAHAMHLADHLSAFHADSVS